MIVSYETTKREINKRLIYECRCDERLKPKPTSLIHCVVWGTGAPVTPKDKDEVNRREV